MHTNQDLGRMQERGGAIALGSAIDYLENVQMHNVYERDKALVGLCPEKMNKINNIEIYESLDVEDRLSVITFNVKEVGCHAVAKVLNLRGNVRIRSGFHCAQPLRDVLGVGPSARVSFYENHIGLAVMFSARAPGNPNRPDQGSEE